MPAKYISLVVFALLVVLASQVGASYMPGPWYAALAKPPWTPPNWLFPVAWTILYVMIALAGWYAWRADGFGVPVMLWGAQLGLNALWTYLMFGQKDIQLALIDVVALWLVIAAFILTVRGASRAAALLFVPYLAWVSFAAALNFEVWRLNP